MKKPLCGCALLAMLLGLALPPAAPTAGEAGEPRVAFFDYVTATPTPRMITYTPSQLDPRQEVNQRKLATSSIRAGSSSNRWNSGGRGPDDPSRTG